METYFIVVENRWPGRWGRGATVKEALRNGNIRAGSGNGYAVNEIIQDSDESPPYVDDFCRLWAAKDATITCTEASAVDLALLNSN